jgi:nickel-dependent lactate racemase
MKQIELAYGSGTVQFSFDDDKFTILAPSPAEEQPLSDMEIGQALDSPIDSPPLEEVLASGQSVLIVVSDATRATASAQVVNLLVRRIIQQGVSAADVAIIFATGIHRQVTAEEKQMLLTPFITQRIRVLDHDAYDARGVIRLGETQRGTPVEVNRALRDFTHVILTGGIGFHYFAGFTGGRKSICPGLASARTISATHMLALDFEKGGRRDNVKAGVLEGNPVHEECESVAAMIEPLFGVNIAVDELGRAVQVVAGHWREAHRVACRAYLKAHSMNIPVKRRIVIAGCGGSPSDINLIQAHKALDMAALACEDGGSIILLAECREGFGRQDFLKWFCLGDSVALEKRLRDSYEVNGQTAWALLTKTERFKVILVSELEPDDVRQMRMVPARSLNEAMSEVDPSAGGFIMPRGAALLPVLLN